MSAEPLPRTPVTPDGGRVPQVSAPTGRPVPPTSSASTPAPAELVGPRLEHARVLIAPMPGGPRLFAAVCRECTWHTGPSSREVAALARAEHRMQHKRGLHPAPYRSVEYTTERSSFTRARVVDELVFDVDELMPATFMPYQLEELAERLYDRGWRKL